MSCLHCLQTNVLRNTKLIIYPDHPSPFPNDPVLEVATQLSRWTNFCLELAELYLVKHKFKRAKAKAVQASQA